MKHSGMLQKISLLLVPAVLYLLLDLPTRLAGFMGLSSFAGPANALPLTIGLLMGPWSAPGMCLGVILSALLAGSPLPELAAQLAGVPIMSCGAWLLWHAKRTEPVSLKRVRDYARLLLIVAALSPLCALPGLALLGGAAWAETALSYAVFSVMVGVPVLILATSILCVRPVYPAGKERRPDLSCEFGGGAGGLDAANEQIEDFCMAHGFPMKKAFAVENCLEELTLRIQSGCGDAPIRVELSISDSVSLHLAYTGIRYNPLRRQAGEEAEDLMSLALIRQRALRASYGYSGGVNRLHVVI